MWTARYLHSASTGCWQSGRWSLRWLFARARRKPWLREPGCRSYFARLTASPRQEGVGDGTCWSLSSMAAPLVLPHVHR